MLCSYHTGNTKVLGYHTDGSSWTGGKKQTTRADRRRGKLQTKKLWTVIAVQVVKCGLQFCRPDST